MRRPAVCWRVADSGTRWVSRRREPCRGEVKVGSGRIWPLAGWYPRLQRAKNNRPLQTLQDQKNPFWPECITYKPFVTITNPRRCLSPVAEVVRLRFGSLNSHEFSYRTAAVCSPRSVLLAKHRPDFPAQRSVVSQSGSRSRETSVWWSELSRVQLPNCGSMQPPLRATGQASPRLPGTALGGVSVRWPKS
jgi:hypothetical protein